MNRRKLWLGGGAAVLVLVVAGGIVWTATGGSSSAKAPAVGASIPTTIVAGQTAPVTDTPQSTTSSTVTSQSTKAEPTRFVARPAVKCSSDGALSGAFPGNDAKEAKQWVTVGHLSGSCDGSSASFHLKGIDTRLLWRSEASSFAAFLVDGNGIDDTAGYADAECSGRCNEQQALVDGPGDFVLRVQSDGGPWDIEVQEYR